MKGKSVLLERIRGCGQDFAVVQLYADDFDELGSREKAQVYWLTEAAIAGRDIWFDQNHREALAVRRILEEILAHPGGVEKRTLRRIADYTRLFWINGGNYGERSKQKFVPDFTFEDLMRAAHAALERGARFSMEGRAASGEGADFSIRGAAASKKDARSAKGPALEAELERLRKTIFDKEFESLSVCKDSAKDIVAESAGNFYGPDVTLGDFDDFREEHQLNSRVVKKDGRLAEEVCRIGGRYSHNLERVVECLEKARALASPEERKVLGLLSRFFRTGRSKDFDDYNIRWVKTRSTVDAILGFIESYKDPRGVKASFEGIVHYIDYKGTKMMNVLGENVKYFEDRMPWDGRYSRCNFDTEPCASSVNVALGSADGGAMAPVGVNLPNDERIRQTHGSKSVILANVREAYKKVSGKKVRREFYLKEDVPLMLRYGDRAEELHTALHEVVGHASGRVLVDDPDGLLKEFARTLEEARAELVGLYFAGDPILKSRGLFTEEEVRRLGEACLKSYAVADFTMLRRVEGDAIQDDHMRALHLINTYLREKVGAIKPLAVDGKTYMHVADLEKMRKGVGALLADIMEIKATGNYERAGDLVCRYGIRINPAWRVEAKERFKRLNIPPYTALVMPRFLPVLGRNGAIEDVHVSYGESLMAQELRLSGYSGEEIERALCAFPARK
jgi:dipeptidyl-peptidase-3